MSSNETYDTDIVDISEFFSYGDSSSSDDLESDQKSTFGEVDSPIKELKAIILSLDWEITDETADSFVDEVDRLAEIWSNDKTVISFLKILRALGKYLRTHKADAHPESVNLLYSVYNKFEKIVLTDEITEDQENVILQEELQKFHNLKEKIAHAAKAASEGKANDSLLSALKSLVLEIDWDITDQTMQKFDIEISKLEKIWRSDNTFLTPLQMMRAIGSYINKNKLDSHPNSIKLLTTVFKNFETMALTNKLDEAQKQALIKEDLEKFAELKKDISKAKDTKPKTPTEVIEATLEQDKKTSDIASESTTEEEHPLAAEEQQETESQVGDRLDDIFATEKNNDLPLPAGGDEVVGLDMPEEVAPLPAGGDEVVGLDMPEEVAPLPAGGDEVVGLDMQEEVAPLPAGGDEVVGLDMQEEVAPLPAGGDEVVGLDMQEEVGDFTESDSLVFDTDEVPAPDSILEETQADVFGADKETSNKIDSHIDDFFGEEQPSASDSSSAPLNTLLNSLELSAGTIDFEPITSEIDTLQKSFKNDINKQMLLNFIQNVMMYIKTSGENADQCSITLLQLLGSSIAEAEKTTDEKELTLLHQKALEQYTTFHETVVIRDLAELYSKTQQIKNILGLS